MIRWLIEFSASFFAVSRAAEVYDDPAAILATEAHFEGAGVYYGATFVEAQLCKGEDVIVVGGGNSAGQAAVFLAGTTNHVYLLVRSDGLADTMSRYLVRRIEQSSKITLLAHTEIVALAGEQHLERVTWRNKQTGATTTKTILHLFNRSARS